MGDQSANLTGMLSQIGSTVGGMGKAFDPINKAATKPRGNMDDPAHLANLAQWATQNGDAAAASLYMSQAREIKEQARRLAAEKKKVTDATTINTATAAYKQARISGDTQAILEAEKALIEAANVTGADANARLDGVSRGLAQQEEAAYVQQARADAAKEKTDLNAFTTELNKVTSEEDIQAIVDNAPDSVAPLAQRAATTRLQYLEAADVRKARDAEMRQDVALDGITINKDLPDNVVSAHEAELAALEEAIKKSTVGGTIEPTVRSSLVKRRDALADRIYGATYSKEMSDYSVQTSRRRDYNGKVGRVAIATPSKAVAADIKKELEQASEQANEEASTNIGILKRWEGSDEITTEMVNAEFRRQQREALDAEYGDLLAPTDDTDIDTAAAEGTAENPITIP